MALSRTAVRRLTHLGVLGVAAYYALWGGEYSAFDLLRLHAEQEESAAELVALRAEVDSLRAAATALESDPATLERVARERFGMIAEGELLYRFVRVDSASPLAKRP